MQTNIDTHDKDKSLDKSGQPKEAADYDSMGGEMLLDCLCGGILGAAFTEALEAPEWVQSIEWDKAADLYDELRDDDKRALVEKLLDEGIDPAKLSKMRKDGTYMRFLAAEAVVHLVDRRADAFLDGAVWDWTSKVSDEVSAADAQMFTARFVDQLKNWVKDVAIFLQTRSPSIDQSKRTKLSLTMLSNRLS
jgi:hypothetical protein